MTMSSAIKNGNERRQATRAAVARDSVCDFIAFLLCGIQVMGQCAQVQSRPSASGSPATADLSIPPYSVPTALIFCRSHGSYSVLRYGIGGLGSGAPPAIAGSPVGKRGGCRKGPFT